RAAGRRRSRRLLQCVAQRGHRLPRRVWRSRRRRAARRGQRLSRSESRAQVTVPAFVRAALVAAVVSIALVRPAAAQGTPDGGRLDLAIGAGWVGGVDLGSAGATEATGAGQRVPIFTTSTTLGSLSLVEGRVGWRLTHALSAQADASFGRPLLRIAVDND